MRRYENSPVGRVRKFLEQHEQELDDEGGMFSSGPKTYTIAPFFVKYVAELVELAKPRDGDSKEYV